MAVLYTTLTHEEYKELEAQMKTFKETVHRTVPSGGYHKSIRLRITSNMIFEFYGPDVAKDPNPK